MVRIGTIRISMLLLLLLPSCQLGTLPPVDTGPPICNTQHSWGNYHLPHDELSPVVTNYSDYDVDLESWNALDAPITLRASGNGFPITIEEGGDADSGWLGLASVRVSGAGHITSAAVTMNRTLLEKYAAVVTKRVLCQEMGHILGLDHQRGADDSCMDDCKGRGSGWLACLSTVAGTTPNAHDGEELASKYRHAVDASPPAACVGAELLVILHTFSATAD